MSLDTKIRLIMLALMDDEMAHHKDAIIDSMSKMNLGQLDEVELDELWKNTNGHGGRDIDGKCSICLDFMNGKQ